MGSTADGKEEVKEVVAKGSQITIDMAAARTLTSSEGGVDNEQFFLAFTIIIIIILPLTRTRFLHSLGMTRGGRY
jgi:hypothetical protein